MFIFNRKTGKDLSSFHNFMPKIITLANKMRLIIVPVSGVKTATAMVMVGTGSKYENRSNNGISHFLEHMFFKGTKKRPDQTAIACELDGLGGMFNAFTTKEYTGYWVKIDATKTLKGLEVLSDMLVNSLFKSSEIQKEKGVIVEELHMYLDNPMMRIEDIFEECLYGDQPAGWDTIGTKQNILGFKRIDFVDYFKSQYTSDNTVICLAGNIKVVDKLLKKADISQQVYKYFKNMKKGQSGDKKAVKEKQKKPQSLIEYKKTDQAHLSLGVRTYGNDYPDKIALKFLAIVLGGSMSSRLFLNLREKKGWAYYVRTSTEFYSDSGYLTTQAGVPLAKLSEAIRIILNEYKKITKKLIDRKEFNRVKDMIRGKLFIQLEASDNIASWYAKQLIMKEKLLSPQNYLKQMENLKPQDIQRVARDIFVNKKLNLALIGPYKKEQDIKTKLKF